MKFPKFGNVHILSGTNPVSMLCAISSSSTFSKPLKVFDIIPLNVFELISNTVTFASCPISAGRHPVNLLLENTTSFKVLTIFPMLLGMQPSRWLLATTRTDTGELPRFSGMVDVNLLSFKNKASSSLLKSSGGNFPSKSLNLRSRYLRSGISRTTSGNDPTKRLLLTSSS